MSVAEMHFINTGLQPGAAGRKSGKPFQRFLHADKPLKRLDRRAVFPTRLKPGVNEMSRMAVNSCKNE
jgi:hypothetical protein